MTNPYCDECLMRHDACRQCGAAIVANLRLHINMNAHGNGKHWCGSENLGYQAMIRAMRSDLDGAREMLSDCPGCGLECVRRADSPVLYDVHGYYGLQGESAVHNCAPAPEPEPVVPTYEEPSAAVVAAPTKPWRVIP
jgi:hypothetical protein